MASQRNPSWTRPLALAGALFLLSTAVYWLEFKKKPESSEKKERARKVFDLSTTQVSDIRMFQGIAYTQLGCLDLSTKQCISGRNSKWEVRAPSKLRADDGNVQSLLSSLNNLLPVDSVDLTSETPEKRQILLAQYGLSEEQRKSSQKVQVVDDSGNLVGLVLGDMHPLGETQFALAERGAKDRPLADDGRVYLLPKTFKEVISKPLSHWRDKKILTIQAHEITGVQFESGKVKFQAIKKDSDWTLNGRDESGSVQDAPGDIENIDNWNSAIAYLSARDFASEQKNSPEGKKLLSGAKRLLQLSLSKGKEPPVTLQLFEQKGNASQKLLMIASNLDPIFELDPSTRQRLEKTTKDLRLSRLLASMDRFDAQEISFQSKSLGSAPIVFLKKDGKWTRRDSSSKEANGDDSRITAILDNLSGNRVKSFLPERKPGSPSLSIEIKAKGTQVLRRLNFWKDGDKVFARDMLSKRNETLEIDPSLSSVLPWEKL